MDFQYFKKIIEKIEIESKEKNESPLISLYNWGEPLIHPEITEITSHLNQKNIQFDISSNLNNKIDYASILRSKPRLFRVSISGGNKNSYEKGHVGGDLNLVMSNLYKIRHTLDKLKIKNNDSTSTSIQIYYHIYKDNNDEELYKIANLCNELNFNFSPGVALFMPIEKSIFYLEGSTKFTKKDRETMARMHLDIDEMRTIGLLGKSKTCLLQDSQVVINFDGSIPLCCTTFDPVNNIGSDFLKISLNEIQGIRKSHNLCSKCMSNGLHDAYLNTSTQIWDEIVNAKQIALNQKYLTRISKSPPVIPNEKFNSHETLTQEKRKSWIIKFITNKKI